MMQTISARDLRRNHPGATTDSEIEIDGKRYKVCRYKSRDDVYELEACKVSVEDAIAEAFIESRKATTPYGRITETIIRDTIPTPEWDDNE